VTAARYQLRWDAWKAASNGIKTRHWFVTRQGLDGQGAEMAAARNGNARWFGSYNAAKAVADELNNDVVGVHASDCASWVQEPCDCVVGKDSV